ncbi:MAG TPA: hypothetical protein VNW04_19020, partial [Puia sp.]|nr:hypothetical protein [Puia sp.]
LTGDKSAYATVNMRFAQIAGEVGLAEIVLTGPLTMNNISVGGTLAIRSKTELASLKMINPRIGNALELMGVEMKGEVDIQFANVARNVFITGGTFPQRVRLIDSTISGNIITSGATFSFVDLGGTTVQGELEIGDKEAKNSWTGDSGLNLRNTKVNALSDAGEESWPEKLELDEFAYASLITATWGNGRTSDIVNRPVSWFLKWLDKDKTYSSQPYNYLARVLNKAGFSDEANRILVAAKDRERDLARSDGRWVKWIGFSLLKWTIGYGYGARYFYSLIWVFVLGLIGVWVVGTVQTGNMHHASLLDRVGFSLDILLPVIEFNDKYKLDFHGWQLAYFYIHKMMGFILSSFVLAGLAGITKREA